MFSNLEQAIIKTIIYSDIFDYPLTLKEIGKWLIKLKIKNEKLKNTIKNSKLLSEKDGYYFLNGRESIVAERIKREVYSTEKLKIAQEVANLVKLIPSIRLIGITGALAMQNGKKEDDIDLFIITSSELLWTTRLIATLLIEITGRRRHPQEKNVNNKICLNMFVDENHLEIPLKEQDLFSAHEVLQMKLIFEKDDTYQKFISTNIWVKKILPNAFSFVIPIPSKVEGEESSERSERSYSSRFPNYLITHLLNYFEFFLKKFQLWYMRNRRTTEIINDGIIRFHPSDAREWVMREYQKRLKQYDL